MVGDKRTAKVELIFIQVNSASEVVFVGWRIGIENVVESGFISPYY